MEGRYDKSRLSSILEATIVTTEGFGLYKNKAAQRLLRQLANQHGIVILTDSDGAGLQIRSFLQGLVPEAQVEHVYIPQVSGREKRKKTGSKEGLLGVEGMDNRVLLDVLERAGIFSEEKSRPRLTKAQLYALGLSGQADSAVLRKRLLKQMDFPTNLSANAFLNAVGALYSYDDLETLVKGISIK